MNKNSTMPWTFKDWEALAKLTRSELEGYGMRMLDDGPTVLMLIPANWHAKLPKGLSLECVDKTTKVVGKDYIDDEHFGYYLLAYGIRVNNS